MKETQHSTDFSKSVKINRKDIAIMVNRKFNSEFSLTDKLYALILKQLTDIITEGSKQDDIFHSKICCNDMLQNN